MGASTSQTKGETSQAAVAARPGNKADPIRAHFNEVKAPGAKRPTSSTCNHCGEVLHRSEVKNLVDHVLQSCKKVTKEIKDEVIAQQNAKKISSGAAALPSVVSRSDLKRKQGDAAAASLKQASVTASFDRAVSKDDARLLNRKLLLFMVMCAIPFAAADSPFFLDWIHTMRPSYTPPGSTALRTTYLQASYFAT